MGGEAAPLRTLIIGGYGFFGGRIARTLAPDPEFQVIVAGRNGERAESFARELLGRAAHPVVSAPLEIGDAVLADRISALGAKLVIHASGPFQG
jgi:short subunit dehydrogenase-like uncharacterized protein